MAAIIVNKNTHFFSSAVSPFREYVTSNREQAPAITSRVSTLSTASDRQA
jgi:hypothetical protein